MLFRSVARASTSARLARTHSLSRNASSLVVIEHKAGKLNAGSLSAVTAAKQVEGDLAGIVIGSKADIDGVLDEVKKIDGLSKVYTAASDAYAHALAENVAPLLASTVTSKSITHLFAAHSAIGKNVFPRIAGALDVSTIPDIIALDSTGTEFTRPIYAGNAILKFKSSDKDAVKVVTVRPTAFDKAPLTGSVDAVEEIAPVEADASTKFVSEELTVSSRPDLATAGKVVSGGRALKSQENFEKVLEPLADVLGAAVDAGYADNSLQVGQTGKVVAPELYVAVGISGAIQHLAGMKESKLIVAINKDPDAPIFQVADAGLVGDLFEVVPELVSKIKK